MFRFPFGTTQELNLDWFLEQWEIFKQEAQTALGGIDHALDDEIQRVEDAMTDLYAARDAAMSAKNDALSYAQSANTSAIGASQSAQNSAASAVTSATQAQSAAQSATSAQSSATNAGTSAGNALTQAQQSEAWATGEIGGVHVPPSAPQNQSNAKQYATNAQLSANAANTAKNDARLYSQDSKAWATGIRNGEPVTSEDETYQNNAKYYAESIAGDAAAAAQSASEAAASAASADGANAQAMIAAAYDATKTYAVGDYVTYNGALYRCKTAISTAEAWTAAHWEAAKVGQDLKDLKSALNEITIPNVVIETMDIMQVATPMIDVGGYAVSATRGGYANNSGTTSCIWDITNETTFYFGASTAPYVSCVVIENPTREWKTQGGYTAVMDGDSAIRYRKQENNLPTENSPYTTNNAIVILTITNNNTAPITITTENGICLDLLQTTGNNKKKAMSQDAVTKALFSESKKMVVKYGAVDTDVGSRGKEQITVFCPTEKGFIKFAIVRCEYDNYNANSWRIDKCYACDDNLNVLFPITYDGEWEMAIQINGAPDYIGGNAHGDEVLTAFHVLIDGIEVSDITTIAEKYCKEIRIVETTLLYNPIDGATLSTRNEFNPIGTHGREYIFNSDGLRLKQVVSLSTSLTLGASYMTMFPILRGNDNVSQLQVTNAYIADNNYTEYDVSVGASGNEGYGWKRDVTMATIWGDDSGISATVEMLKQPNIENLGARQFQVQDTANAYNKLYWSICGVGGYNYEASSGERFETDSLYKISAKIIS